jgi:polyhydroxyalkanoate synthesis regulator phasin
MINRFYLAFGFSAILNLSHIQAQDIKIPRGAEMNKIIDQLAAQGMFSKEQAEAAKIEMQKMDDTKWKQLESQANQQVQQMMNSGAVDEYMKDPSKMQNALGGLDKEMFEKFKEAAKQEGVVPNEKMLKKK